MRHLPLVFSIVLVAAGCTPSDGDAATPPVAADADAAAPAAADVVAAGRFGCTRSVYHATDGTYEFQPRGFVEFDGDGGYAYRGFESPSEGRVVADGAARRFAGGYLDGGEFVPVEDRPGQYTLTAPGIDERWSCKDTDGE